MIAAAFHGPVMLLGSLLVKGGALKKKLDGKSA
jgi:hypothetical protein